MDTYETQQKVLEHALERLDTTSQPDNRREEEAAPGAMKGKSAATVQKYALMMLFDTLDLEKTHGYISNVKPTVYALEYYYHKPLKECSLKEVVDGLVATARAIGWYDSADYVDNGDRYTLKITHSLGLTGSKVAQMANDVIFVTYGARFETAISEKDIIQTIYKN